MKTTTLRSTAITARVGLWARRRGGGVFYHRIDQPLHPAPATLVLLVHPARLAVPVTQGLHVISGIAAIPLIVVKLRSVWPKL